MGDLVKYEAGMMHHETEQLNGNCRKTTWIHPDEMTACEVNIAMPDPTRDAKAKKHCYRDLLGSSI